MVSVRSMCSMSSLSFRVSGFQSSGTKACFVSNFLLFRIMCARYQVIRFVRRIPLVYGF